MYGNHTVLACAIQLLNALQRCIKFCSYTSQNLLFESFNSRKKGKINWTQFFFALPLWSVFHTKKMFTNDAMQVHTNYVRSDNIKVTSFCYIASFIWREYFFLKSDLQKRLGLQHDGQFYPGFIWSKLCLNQKLLITKYWSRLWLWFSRIRLHFSDSVISIEPFTKSFEHLSPLSKV